MTRDPLLQRVIAPAGVLPQAATQIDAVTEPFGTEIAISVDSLNLDSASFRDLREHTGGHVDRLRTEVRSIIHEHGKMQNPRTGSGGMLVGTITAAGPDADPGFHIGDRVATLISLTATPLRLDDELERWDGQSEVVPTSGRAIVFSSAALGRLPDDLSMQTSLSVLDVCGAPAHVDRLAGRPLISGGLRRMLVIGGGKSAVLSAAAARRHGIEVVCAVPTDAEADRLRAQDLFDIVVVADATRPGAVRDAVLATGQLTDLTLVCVNAPGCEHAPLVATRPGGAIVYFSMATSFTAVALGAEALALDFDLFFGTGYVPGHADLAIALVRDDERVRRFFDGLHSPAPATSTEDR